MPFERRADAFAVRGEIQDVMQADELFEGDLGRRLTSPERRRFGAVALVDEVRAAVDAQGFGQQIHHRLRPGAALLQPQVARPVSGQHMQRQSHTITADRSSVEPSLR